MSTKCVTRSNEFKKCEKISNHSEKNSPSFDDELTPKTKGPSHVPYFRVQYTLKNTLLIIGSAVVCFPTQSNSIIWRCQRFWLASSDFWQTQWNKFLNIIGEDPFNLYVTWTFVLSMLSYWIVGGLYTYMDIAKKPSFLRQYKIQPDVNEAIETKQILKIIGGVLFNQTVITIPVTNVLYEIIKYRGVPEIRQLPTFHWIILDLIVCFSFLEIGFYYLHRVFHYKFFYKYLHKQHHEMTPSIAIAALYANPLEFLLGNLIPVASGAILMRSHIVTIWLFAILVLPSSPIIHSGYHLPFCMSPEAHHFHHIGGTECYGIIGLLDYLHGTDTNFRKSRGYDRHIIRFSLMPVREAIPDLDPGEDQKEK